jgi:hypothetical protein
MHKQTNKQASKQLHMEASSSKPINKQATKANK